MSLTLHTLSLSDFRNYRSFLIEDIGDTTIFVGRNAIGKTNLIEAISLMTALSSFRRPRIDHLIREGSPQGRVDASFSGDGRKIDLSLRIESGKRRYFLNGKAKRPGDLQGLAPSVVFTPDDLELAKGSHSVRRETLDMLGCQLSANHGVVKKDYETVIRYKNRLLKEEADPALLESIDDMVVTCGAQLSWYRATLFSRLMPLIAQSYSVLSAGRDVCEGVYLPSWVSEGPGEADAPGSFFGSNDDEARPKSQSSLFGIATAFRDCAPFTRDEARDCLRDAIEQRRSEERCRKVALAGPHRDKIVFYINGRNASSFASQGQQRSLVLAVKLAEVALIEEKLGQKPLLLLDDVMSELDSSRRAALMSCADRGLQTFITTTTLDYFDDAVTSKARIVRLEDGEGPGGEGGFR